MTVMRTGRRLDTFKWDIPSSITKLSEIERYVIAATLDRTGGNKAAAADLLGIYRPLLYSKIRKFGIPVRIKKRR